MTLKDKSNMTNQEVVAHIMTHSRFGALSEMFVIEAIRSYSDTVASAPSVQGNAFIDGEAWQGFAKEIKETMDEKYGL